jgi:hypothetical protein
MFGKTRNSAVAGCYHLQLLWCGEAGNRTSGSHFGAVGDNPPIGMQAPTVAEIFRLNHHIFPKEIARTNQGYFCLSIFSSATHPVRFVYLLKLQELVLQHLSI